MPAKFHRQNMKRFFRYFRIIPIVLLATGCIAYQPQNTRHAGYGWYKVKPTDTLYSIAWRYGLDYKALAQWNQISDDYTIYPGQRLIMQETKRLPAPQAVIALPAEEPPAVLPAKTAAVKSVDNAQPPDRWLWPVNGKLLNSFSLKQLDQRGIDIAGELGQSIRASAAGKVVYSGDGLAGYGNLIIIKHSEDYLSAYAYLKQRLVSEGMNVKAGSIIAEMGQPQTKSPRLHFEIRKNGKPVDPMEYLTKN